jgi:hypothetical protein
VFLGLRYERHAHDDEYGEGRGCRRWVTGAWVVTPVSCTQPIGEDVAKDTSFTSSLIEILTIKAHIAPVPQQPPQEHVHVLLHLHIL